MSDEWQILIKRYADGRPICNCGCAYYKPVGHGSVYDKALGRRVDKTDMLACQYGCEANQYSVKDEIARKVLAELEGDAEMDRIWSGAV